MTNEVSVTDGVLRIEGRQGVIIVCALSVRQVNRKRVKCNPRASLHWIDVIYENAQGVLQTLTVEMRSPELAELVSLEATRLCLVEQGKQK